jgi:excisionase family DNA binding protein
VKDAVQDVLTTKQASELLNMSASSVQKLVMSGELEAWVTPGGHRRIYRTSIERFAQQRQTPPPTIDPSRGFQILLAEDDPAQVFYMKKLLAGTRSPVELVIASDASQALIQIERHRPDLVITDLVMEPFDGFHLVKVLDSDPQYRAIDVIVVTGMSRDEAAALGTLPDWVPMFQKPLAPERLLGYLDALLSRTQRAAGAGTRSG